MFAAVGLENGENYETAWLHRLRQCDYLTVPQNVLHIDFAAATGTRMKGSTSGRTGRETPIQGERIMSMLVKSNHINRANPDAIVSWFALHLDNNPEHTLLSRPGTFGNSCWEQAVYPLAPAAMASLSAALNSEDKYVQLAVHYSDDSVHYEVTSVDNTRHRSPVRQNIVSNLGPRIGEVAIRRLNSVQISQRWCSAMDTAVRSFETQHATSLQTVDTPSSSCTISVLDMSGDYSCSALAALRASRFATVLSTGISRRRV